MFLRVFLIAAFALGFACPAQTQAPSFSKARYPMTPVAPKSFSECVEMSERYSALRRAEYDQCHRIGRQILDEEGITSRRHDRYLAEAKPHCDAAWQIYEDGKEAFRRCKDRLENKERTEKARDLLSLDLGLRAGEKTAIEAAKAQRRLDRLGKPTRSSSGTGHLSKIGRIAGIYHRTSTMTDIFGTRPGLGMSLAQETLHFMPSHNSLSRALTKFSADAIIHIYDGAMTDLKQGFEQFDAAKPKPSSTWRPNGHFRSSVVQPYTVEAADAFEEAGRMAAARREETQESTATSQVAALPAKPSPGTGEGNRKPQFDTATCRYLRKEIALSREQISGTNPTYRRLAKGWLERDQALFEENNCPRTEKPFKPGAGEADPKTCERLRSLVKDPYYRDGSRRQARDLNCNGF
ncbi:hypothetical protein [Oricola sp.]|uniref:hypothetical protein n=1 Tax=Oricola sp. TaxID=1979950 RepID=UPI003BABA840